MSEQQFRHLLRTKNATYDQVKIALLGFLRAALPQLFMGNILNPDVKRLMAAVRAVKYHQPGWIKNLVNDFGSLLDAALKPENNLKGTD